MIKWRLKEVLDSHRLTAYKLAAEAHGQVNRNTVYALARGELGRVDLGTLDGVLGALDRLTGERHTVCDLLEIVRD